MALPWFLVVVDSLVAAWKLFVSFRSLLWLGSYKSAVMRVAYDVLEPC